MPRKSNGALIGFWLVLGASQEHPLIVCPAIIREAPVEKIEDVSVEEAWKVAIQIPIDAHKDSIMLMVPEIINITNLDKPVGKYESLWKIQAVKAKCESLATKYIDQFRATKK